MKDRRRAVPSAPDGNKISAASPDGVIAFRLSPYKGGIHVERIQVRRGASRVVHSILFDDDESFARWCDDDRLKYSYPLVYVTLRRSASALFDRQR